MTTPAYKLPSLAVLTVHGGFGDFLFQLDLAKRLESVGIPTRILARKNYLFFQDILAASNVGKTHIVRADGWRYVFAILSVWLRAVSSSIAIINSFHATKFRLPTRIYYALAHKLSAEVIISSTTGEVQSPYTQFVYADHELIWQRNNRIVSYLARTPVSEEFPVLTFATGEAPVYGSYLHIHPVGSLLQKSYPPKKLIAVLEALGPTHPIVLTLTPREERWYVTEELRAYIAAHPHITFISKQFSFAHLTGCVAHADVVCTVNTGILWLALIMGKRIVVCDTHTDFEWNPVAYGQVTRLSEDFDERGQSLHLKLVEHEDGTFYESMYRIEPEKVAEAIRAAVPTT